MSELKYKVGDFFKETHAADCTAIEFHIISTVTGNDSLYYVEYLHTGEGGNYNHLTESYIDKLFHKTGDFITGRNGLIGRREDGVHFPNMDNDFAEITSSICKMLEVKNKRYGGAALNPKNIFAKHHSYGSRIDEKLDRVENSEELRKNDVVDIIGGLILICKDKGWKNFDDQID